MISYKNINLSFGENSILEDFSLKIDRGEKILISGKSGKGKSTLLRLLMGFETPDSGSIIYNNNELSSHNIFKWRQNFAYVNQDVTIRSGLGADVLKDIALFTGNNFPGDLTSDLCELLEFDPALLKKDTESLSGGERQRLGIIVAIMLNRPVFLLDEVTSALDKHLKCKVVEYFEASDKIVISVSHDNVWSESNSFRKVVW